MVVCFSVGVANGGERPLAGKHEKHEKHESRRKPRTKHGWNTERNPCLICVHSVARSFVSQLSSLILVPPAHFSLLTSHFSMHVNISLYILSECRAMRKSRILFGFGPNSLPNNGLKNFPGHLRHGTIRPCFYPAAGKSGSAEQEQSKLLSTRSPLSARLPFSAWQDRCKPYNDRQCDTRSSRRPSARRPLGKK